MKRFIICIVTLALALFFEVGGVCASVASTTRTRAIDNTRYCAGVISDRVEETLDLLISLSNTELFQGTEMPYKQKAASLTKISKQFGYMMIRVLDAEFNVYSETVADESGISSNLSKRSYLQNLKNTLTPQVTDAFLAGADGATVNFTVAVPIAEDGVFKGALFAAIYESDFGDMLEENGAVLVGSDLQYMSGVETEDVGITLDTIFENIWLWGANMEDRLLEIKRESSYDGFFWGMAGLDVEGISYSKVINTNWNVVSRITFADAICSMPGTFSFMIIAIAATAFALVGAIYHRRWFFVELPPVQKVKSEEEDEI